MARREGSHVVGGILLILLGVILLGDQLNLITGWDMGRLWPLLLVTMGTIFFFTPGRESRRGGALWLVFVGLIFSLHTWDIVHLHDSWPLFVVAGGASILFSAYFCQRNGADAHVEPGHEG